MVTTFGNLQINLNNNKAPLAGGTINFSPYTYANCNPVMMNDPTGGKAEGTGDGDPPANDPQTHNVEEGDTLSGLAEKYGTTVDNLRTLNPQTQKRKQSDQINIGETLSISGESPGSSLPSSEKAKTIQSKAYVIGEKEPVDVDLPTPEALKEGNWEHHRQEWLAKNARSISLFNTKGGTVGLRASQEIFADYAGPMMIQAYAAALFELAFAAPYVLPASRVGRVAPKVKVPAPLPAKRISLKSFNSLDDLGQLFKNKNLTNVSDDLVSSGWKKLEGDWGTRSVFEKQIGNKRFYAQWETNVVHSTNNKPVSYWKLTYGKINATSKNTIRVSPYPNFKP
ncbi:LysM peptidoglycan-binding domain-containing protein [Cytophagaceae bacterium ABcell3]|nr:LysM peptidoglycan-binding domain-containing protein [Cytophagaceae bacterium ABcell3]